MKPGIKKRMELLSDELAMYSSQLREALSGGGDPPHPWNIEPWLSEYARAFKEWKSPNVEHNRRPQGVRVDGPVGPVAEE